VSWWIVWRDLDDRVHHENGGQDAIKAQRIMAERALPRAKAAVALLRSILRGRPYYPDEGDSGGETAEPEAAGGTRRKAAANPRRGAGAEEAGGEK